MNMLESTQLPQWLIALLTEKFFNACIIHEDAKKNEKNVFCLDCCECICPHCLSPHRSHRLLQIRRYVYHDVIRLCDAEKLLDCAFVQSYTSNSAKVVFLNHRPKTRPCRGSSNTCIICERGLQDPYLFCSISCKVEHILKTEGKLSKYIYKCDYMTLSEPGLDDGQMTPDTILEPVDSGSSCSGGAVGEIGCRTVGCTATTEVVRKKRSTLPAFRSAFQPVCGPGSEMSVSMMNRRKGTPQRSPLY
ncbi:protein RGF1 INDUCIBLE TRANSCRIPTION FACTOR 1 [Nicotiana sylvestris]|uniref:Uncharacterized protein LOC104239998 n=1 Tax=Nicotiana sylvestris TaxID=4096 RepID=A0A1U7XM05_NICSY|nr:PREDICTED: uncharacterized protein LOC104239998 [Nicotiana sylvestris]